MNKTWIIDIGKMIEMLIPLVLCAAVLLSMRALQAKKALCRIPARIPRKNPLKQ